MNPSLLKVFVLGLCFSLGEIRAENPTAPSNALPPLSLESFFQVELTSVKIEATSLHDAWGQVAKLFAQKYPMVPMAEAAFFPNGRDTLEDAKVEWPASIKLRYDHVTMRQLVYDMAALAGAYIQCQDSRIKFISAGPDLEPVHRTYLFSKTWRQAFDIPDSNDPRYLESMFDTCGVKVKVWRVDTKSGWFEVSSTPEGLNYVEFLLRAAQDHLIVPRKGVAGKAAR